MLDMQKAICMQLRRFCSVSNCMLSVSVSEVGVVRGLLVISGQLVFGRFLIVVSRTLMMARRQGKPVHNSCTYDPPSTHDHSLPICSSTVPLS